MRNAACGIACRLILLLFTYSMFPGCNERPQSWGKDTATSTTGPMGTMPGTGGTDAPASKGETGSATDTHGDTTSASEPTSGGNIILGTDAPVGSDFDTSLDGDTDTSSGTETAVSLDCVETVSLTVVSSTDVSIALVGNRFVYRLVFSNPVPGFSKRNITWVSGSGSGMGTVGEIVQLAPAEYEIEVVNAYRNDTYTMVIDSAITDTCGQSMDSPVPVLFQLNDCDDAVAGRPEVTSASRLYPRGAENGTYRLQFSENVYGVDIDRIDLIPEVGSGELVDVTQVDERTFDVRFTGVIDNDRYRLEVANTVSDLCGNRMASTSPVYIYIWGDYFFDDFDALLPAALAGQNGWRNGPADDASSAAGHEWNIAASHEFEHFLGEPEMDHTSSAGQYAAAGGADDVTQEVTIQTRPIDLGEAFLPQLSFWYFMDGLNAGALEVMVRCGGETSSIWRFDGPAQTMGTDPWRNQVVDLTAFVGSRIQIIFAVSSTEVDDAIVAIDDVWVREPIVPETEFRADAVSPGTAQLVRFVDMSSDAPTRWEWVFEGPGAPVFEEGTTAASQNPVVRFPVAGIYDVTLTVSNSNGSASRTEQGGIEVDAAYLVEDFDMWAETDIFGQEAWTMIPFDYSEPSHRSRTGWWQAQSSSVQRLSGGPETDHTGNGGLYLASRKPEEGETSVTVLTPTLNLTDAVSPLLSFWYFIDQSTGETLEITVSSDTGDADHDADTILTLDRQLGANTSSGWVQVFADLSAYTGQVVRIGFYADDADTVSVDDVVIREPAQISAAFSTIDTSVGRAQVVPFVDETVDVAKSWQWSFEGPGAATFVNDTNEVSQNPLVVFDTPGVYSVSLVAGNGAGQDTVTRTDYITVADVWYAEGFESFAEGTLWQKGWRAEDENHSALHWRVVDETAGLPEGALLSGSSSDGVKYAFSFGSDETSDSPAASMVSVALDLAGLTAPVLDFSYFFNGFDAESLSVHVLDVATDTLHSNVLVRYALDAASSTEWQRTSINLAPFSGQLVRVVFFAERHTGRTLCPIGVDDLWLREMTPPVASMSAFLSSVVTGERILLQDQSTELISTREWQISGPGPILWLDNTDSASKDPVISLEIPGLYTVALQVGNAAGVNEVTTGDFLMVSPTYFLETFDDFSFAAPDGQFGWTSAPVVEWSDIRWIVDAQTYAQKHVAPLHSVAGVGRFAVTEQNGDDKQDEALMVSPEIDLSEATSPMLDFWYFRSGVGVGDIVISVDNGTDITDLLTLTGAQQQGWEDPWERAVVDLSGFAGQTVRLQFLGIPGEDGFSAIDHISVHED
ncbi:MAG: choice-of-anchor J domain-containing protein [Deltaproteobacteria bacterium]|nr:choice-of-anchor J domain-containing protein [Deltaproteobacteria bacterium]